MKKRSIKIISLALWMLMALSVSFAQTPDSLTKALLKEHEERVKMIEDQGIHHDFHKENIGEILFSDREIGIKTKTDKHLKNNFTNLSNGIYGQVFLSQSLKNTRLRLGLSTDYEKGYSIQYYVDGMLIYTVHHRRISVEEDEEWTSWQVIPAPQKEDDYKNKTSHGFAEVLMRIQPGKRQFRIVLLAVNDPLKKVKEEVASGEFSLSFSEADRKDFISKYEVKHPSNKQ